MKLKGPGPLGTILLLGAHLNIIVGGPFKLVGKHEIEGARALWINIIIDYCCTRVLLYAKRLKETEETIVFFVTFLSLVAFQLGVYAYDLGPVLITPSGYAYDLGPVLIKLMQLERVADEGLEAEPPAAGWFCDFAATNSDFNAILQFVCFWSHMKKLNY